MRGCFILVEKVWQPQTLPLCFGNSLKSATPLTIHSEKISHNFSTMSFMKLQSCKILVITTPFQHRTLPRRRRRGSCPFRKRSIPFFEILTNFSLLKWRKKKVCKQPPRIEPETFASCHPSVPGWSAKLPQKFNYITCITRRSSINDRVVPGQPTCKSADPPKLMADSVDPFKKIN